MSDAAADTPLARRGSWLESYRPRLRVREQGAVVSLGDGIAWIRGLPSAAVEEVLEFGDGSRAVVFDLERDLVGAVLLHQGGALTAGASASDIHNSRSSNRSRCSPLRPERTGARIISRVPDAIASVVSTICATLWASSG